MILLPELECLLAFLEISSATNEVAMLNNAILKNFDSVENRHTDVKHASSRTPSEHMPRLSQ
jgi:competence transcription factor ComK